MEVLLESGVRLEEVVAVKGSRAGRAKKSKKRSRSADMAVTTMSKPSKATREMKAAPPKAPATYSAPSAAPPPPPPSPAYPTETYEEVITSDMVEMEMGTGAKTTTTSGSLPGAGKLTAGIINDFGKWTFWQDITETKLKQLQSVWKIYPQDRFTLQLKTPNGYPIVNATVKLMDKRKVVWETKTDNTGKAELWANLFEKGSKKNFYLKINYNNKNYKIESITEFHKGINIKELPVSCDISNKVDIAFLVDATGSMKDEINYLKSELEDVIQRSQEALKDSELRIGSVFYRDHGDAYLTRNSHFSTNIPKTINFIKKQNAAGGGDYPEAIEEALDVALNKMVWSEEAASRLLFLLMDAPPHQTEEMVKKIQGQIQQAAKMGIRIIPVACSGTNRSTEYLMRSIALATNGSYLYLTDDSGIGGSHLKPITDEHKVNLLNDLLVKTITNFAQTMDCDEQIDIAQEEVQDTSEVELVLKVQNEEDPNKIDEQKAFAWKYYPNPTVGQIWVELEGKLDYLFLMDTAGKLLQRIEVTDQKFQIDLSAYPSGIYFLRGIGPDEQEVQGKVIRTHTY